MNTPSFVNSLLNKFSYSFSKLDCFITTFQNVNSIEMVLLTHIIRVISYKNVLLKHSSFLASADIKPVLDDLVMQSGKSC